MCIDEPIWTNCDWSMMPSWAKYNATLKVVPTSARWPVSPFVMAPGAPKLLKTTVPWLEQRFGDATPTNRSSVDMSFWVLVISFLHLFGLPAGRIYLLWRPGDSDESY